MRMMMKGRAEEWKRSRRSVTSAWLGEELRSLRYTCISILSIYCISTSNLALVQFLLVSFHH